MNRYLMCSALITSLVLTGCGSGINPAHATLTGTWNYSIQSQLFQTTQTGTASLQQTGTQVNGNASLSASPCTDFVTISRTIRARRLLFRWTRMGTYSTSPAQSILRTRQCQAPSAHLRHSDVRDKTLEAGRPIWFLNSLSSPCSPDPCTNNKRRPHLRSAFS